MHYMKCLSSEFLGLFTVLRRRLFHATVLVRQIYHADELCEELWISGNRPIERLRFALRIPQRLKIHPFKLNEVLLGDGTVLVEMVQNYSKLITKHRFP